MPVTLVADHIRSAMNVGSMVRSLEFFGADHFAAIGYTPTLDHPLVHKTSLGTESYLRKEAFPTLGEALVSFKTRGIHTVAFETCARAIPFAEWQPTFPLALVFGHERNGIAAQDLQACDQVVAIPGYGRKNSLNVAVTTGIVLHKVRQAWEQANL
jgi:tRNA G18 (ribose-2'-O)-methylase SpoU